MFGEEIIKVIYAPHKAFKEIIQNPKYTGPVLIMVLFIVANLGVGYAIATKTYVEKTLPTAEQRDIWTENSTLWTSVVGEPPKQNSNDYINGTLYYGNKSVEFSNTNSTQIVMQLTGIGSVNCSGPNGYKSLSIRIKWTRPTAKPETVSFYLLSGNGTDHFYHNLTGSFSDSSSNIWNNLTIPLITGWSNNSATANWANITGLELGFTWSQTSNITVLIDDLLFRGIFTPSIGNLNDYLFNFSLYSAMQFIVRWVFLGGLIFLMARAFKAKIVWRPLLVLVGFALITIFMQAIINTAAFTTLPTLYYRLEFFTFAGPETEIARTEIADQTLFVSQVNRYSEIIFLFWTIALCAIAVRLLTQFSWSKSFLIPTVGYFAALLAQSFLLGF